MAGVLEGIRVVDWTLYQAGPYATRILGDLGADVIHVESPDGGDGTRAITRVIGNPTTRADGFHVVFEEMNWNKRSITANLRTPKGREIVHRLCAVSDVFVTNFRPSAREKAGMDAATIRAINPKIIYASTTGFGELGPDAEAPAMDIVVQARSGWMWLAGERGTPPTQAGPGVADRITSIELALGIVAALFSRERRGVAQDVTTNMLASCVRLLGQTALLALNLEGRCRPSREESLNALYNHYRCQDGVWIALALLEGTRHWPSFCEAAGRADLLTDPRFDTWDKRLENHKELVKIMDQMFPSKTFAEWSELLKRADILFSRVNEYGDLPHDPMVIENQILLDYEHPTQGRLKVAGFPVKLSEEPQAIRMPAPELGQHTEEVLTELCGYSWDEVVALRDGGAI